LQIVTRVLLNLDAHISFKYKISIAIYGNQGKIVKLKPLKPRLLELLPKFYSDLYPLFFRP